MVTETETCAHSWAIEPAHRRDHGGVHPMSPGVCRLCGEVREFENSIDKKIRFGGQLIKPKGQSGGSFDSGG